MTRLLAGALDSFSRVLPRRMAGHARVAFAFVWLTVQGTLVLTAGGRPDHVFGFRMFPEASTLEIHLSRETPAGRQAAPRGEWTTRDAAGLSKAFAWRDRVRDPILRTLDVRVFASYGVDAQLARLQRALDDVADHLDGDTETQRLRADVVVRKNGRDPVVVTLLSHTRAV